MLAALKGRLDIVGDLLANGSDVNARGADGKTALMVAENISIRSLLAQAAAKTLLKKPNK